MCSWDFRLEYRLYADVRVGFQLLVTLFWTISAFLYDESRNLLFCYKFVFNFMHGWCSNGFRQKNVNTKRFFVLKFLKNTHNFRCFGAK